MKKILWKLYNFLGYDSDIDLIIFSLTYKLVYYLRYKSYRFNQDMIIVNDLLYCVEYNLSKRYLWIDPNYIFSRLINYTNKEDVKNIMENFIDHHQKDEPEISRNEEEIFIEYVKIIKEISNDLSNKTLKPIYEYINESPY